MPDNLYFREFNPYKIWHHSERLVALARGNDIAPVTVEVDPVAYCNHKCFWCVDPSHRSVVAGQDFFWSLLNELSVFEVNGFGVRGIVFKGGGEPTLHPDFADLVEYTRGLGFEVGVVTNGSCLLKSGLAEALAEYANYVRISIDGPTPETHQRIHGTRDFTEIVEGVQRLVALRQARHPIIGLSFAMDYAMIPVIPEAIALGNNLGVDYVLIRPPFFEEVGRPTTMTPGQASALRKALVEGAQTYIGPMGVLVGMWVGDLEREQARSDNLVSAGRRDHQISATPPIEHRLRQCWAAPLLAVVAADGQVYGCCNLRYLDNWSFGRIDYGSGITFADVWASQGRHQVLARMHNTECIAHCTHPLSRYNDIIEVLRDDEKPHSGFV